MYPGRLEVIIAEGASTDGSRKTAAALVEQNTRVLLVDNPAGTTAAGLNRAIRASSGSVIVRCDARSVLPPGYIRLAVELLEETAAANVGGMQVPAGETPLQRAIAMAMSSRLGAGDARFRIGGESGPTDTVYLGVFRRDSIEALGLFDERFLRNQDYELNWRIRSAGGVVFFDPRLQVGYQPRGSLVDLGQQYWEYGLWKRRMLRLHPKSIRVRQLAAPFLVVGLACSGLLALTPWPITAAILPVVYGTTVFVATGWSWWRTRDGSAMMLPAVYPTMHIGWGMGFLVGSSGVSLSDPEEGSGQE
jgi:glycosyltransferase involved in cell wall biosynthesis